MWRHAHEDEGAKAHSLAIVNVSGVYLNELPKQSF